MMKTDIPTIGSDLESASFEISVPSLDPTDLGGGTGAISLTTGPQVTPQKLRNTRFTLTDDLYGSITGRISQVSWGSGSVSFTGETMLQRLTVTARILPTYLVSTSTAINAALAHANMACTGLPTGDSVAFPGFAGSVLDYLKYFCAVYGYEFYPTPGDPDNITFRAIRGAEYSGGWVSKDSDVNDQTIAKSIDIVRYTYTVPAEVTDNIELTPAGTSDAQILTVNAQETVQYDVRLNGWARSVNQPVPMDLIGPEERTDAGAYCVSGSDGLPVSAMQWTETGGSVRVEITDDPAVLRVTITGPKADTLISSDGTTDRFAPYSLTASAGSVTYNSLHITGKGIRTAETTQNCPTGAVSEVTMQAVGATVSNPFVTTVEDQWNVGVRAAQVYAGSRYTQTISGHPDSDALGTLGSRVVDEAAKFRVETVTVNPDLVSFTAVADTLFSDFNAVWAGSTFNDFRKSRTGVTFADFNVDWNGRTFADFDAVWAGQKFSAFAQIGVSDTFSQFAVTPLVR